MSHIADTAWITKEQAHVKLPDEHDINIDRNGYDFNFTKNWFGTRNRVTYTTFLGKQYDGTWPVNHIQIGVFEGMDLVWLLQNCLRHPDSRVIAMDPWLKHPKMSQAKMDAVKCRAFANLWPWADKVMVVRDKSTNVLTRMSDGIEVKGRFISPGEWDLAVIDGDHRGRTVYTDGVSVLDVLKPGGWMLFDDVRMSCFQKGEVPHGLDYFLRRHGERLNFVAAHRVCNIYEKL